MHNSATEYPTLLYRMHEATILFWRNENGRSTVGIGEGPSEPHRNVD